MGNCTFAVRQRFGRKPARNAVSVLGGGAYHRRNLHAYSILELSPDDDLVAEAAEKIVTGEAARYTVEGQAHLSMSLPSVAEVAALRTQYLAVSGTQHQAVEKTDHESEELAALYATAYALAVDIYESVEFFYRKDPDPGSFRIKCQRWGVVYIYEEGAPVTPPANPGGNSTLPATNP